VEVTANGRAGARCWPFENLRCPVLGGTAWNSTAGASVVPDTVAPEFDRFVRAKQAAGEYRPGSAPMAAGEVAEPIFTNPREAAELISVAAKRAAGLFRPTKRTEVVWVDGDSRLAVGLTGIEVVPADGLLTVVIPVRCDQTGPERVRVVFAVGSERQPAGLFAAAHRRPTGPAVVVETWGENLVAYAWQCVLGLVSGVAGAAGKDNRGNILVPAELTVNPDGIGIVPMARHRFSGSTGLATRAPGPRRVR
jgi:hypothetical protein